jgi:hypothetical protein
MAQVKNTKDREGKAKRHERIHFYKSREVKERKIKFDFSALARKRDRYNMHPKAVHASQGEHMHPKTRVHTSQGNAGRSIQQRTDLHVWAVCSIYYNRYRSVRTASEICCTQIKAL